MLILLREALRLVWKKPLDDSNLAQRLHFRTTVAMMTIFVTVITTGQYFGRPMTCLTDRSFRISDDHVSSSCYWTSNYIVVDKYEFLSIYTGVKPPRPGAEIVRIAYYQWIMYLIASQILLFYLGRYIFRSNENSCLLNLIDDLKRELDFYRRRKREIQNKFDDLPHSFSNTYRMSKMRFALLDQIVERLRVSANLKCTKTRGYYYIISEIVNLTFLIVLIHATNILLRGEFLFLGHDFVNNPRGDFLEYIFPRVTKCLLYLYGPSGTTESVDALCVNSLNTFYEKLFIFLWFWYLFLLAVTLSSLLFHGIVSLLFNKSSDFVRFALKDLSADSGVRKLSRIVSYTEWIYLSHLRKNVEPKLFRFYTKLLIRDLDLSMA